MTETKTKTRTGKISYKNCPLHSKAKVCVFSVLMMVKLSIYHTGMCIKGPESWWIAKSITPQLVVNQFKINPQLPSVVVD